MLETDLRAQYVQAMGPDLGQLYFELRDDFDWLRRKWSDFRDLFDKGPERVELLNVVACNFFSRVMRQSFEDAMLHLCRLTDPPKTHHRNGDRISLTLLALTNMISDPTLRATVLAKTDEVQLKCKFARTWRNRRLAHTDLACLREGLPSTLPEVKSAGIQDALKSIDALLTLIEDHYRMPHFMLGTDPWGAKSLVYYLERGRRAIDDEREQWNKQAAQVEAQSQDRR